MDFELTMEQQAMQQMARDFTRNEIMPLAAEYDEKDEMPEELVRNMVKQGFSSIAIPEEYGGGGMDELTVSLVTEELGRGCAGIATAVGANSLACYPILIAGNEEQKKKYLTMACEGSLACFCLTEPDAGSDVSAISTTAIKDGDDYVINGTKCFITNGGVADIHVVFAVTDPQRGCLLYTSRCV